MAGVVVLINVSHEPTERAEVEREQEGESLTQEKGGENSGTKTSSTCRDALEGLVPEQEGESLNTANGTNLMVVD